jgi:hypothetical protein
MPREISIAYGGVPIAGLRESTRGDQWVFYTSTGRIRHHLTVIDPRPGASSVGVVRAEPERAREGSGGAPEVAAFDAGAGFDAEGALVGATRGRLAGQRVSADLGVARIEVVEVPAPPAQRGAPRRRASVDVPAEAVDRVIEVHAALRPPAAAAPAWLLDGEAEDAVEDESTDRVFQARDTSGTVELILQVTVTQAR